MRKLLLILMSLTAVLSIQALGTPSDPQVREYQFSSFDKPNPRVTVTHLPTTDNANQGASIRKAKGDSEPEVNTVPVKIRFLHDTNKIRPSEVFIINKEEKFTYRTKVDGEGTCLVEMPEGIFDFSFSMTGVAYFDESDQSQGWISLGTYFYNIDDVEVKEDMPVIEVDAGECHPIVPEFQLANGEGLQPDLIDSTDPDNEIVLTPGNIAYSSFDFIPYNTNSHNKYGIWYYQGTIKDHANLNTKGQEYHTIYVNDTSDRWVYFGCWRYINADVTEVYSFNALMKPSDNEVSMKADEQILLPWNFSRSKSYEGNADKRIEFSSIDYSYLSKEYNRISGGGAIGLQVENPKVYVADKTHGLVRTGYVLTDVEAMNDWWMNSGIGSCEMAVIDGELQFLQTQRGAFGAILMGGAYDEAFGNTTLHDAYIKGHNRFSTSGMDFNPVFGLTAPILRVVNDISYDEVNDIYSNRISPTVVGQYGETRDSDVECGNFSTKIIYNGEVVEENYIGDPMMFCMEWCQADHDKGVMEYEMYTENIFEDGIEGYNKTYIYTDQTKEDPTAPTLTQLMCRDTDDRIANRFNTAEQGVVEFSASDFSSEEYWVPQGWNFTWFESHPIFEVKTEWSSYGMNEWNEFEVEEVPEYFEEGYGHFYRGSLSGVDKESANNWYDLRITLRDATGNWQQQTISPVFRIETVAAVDQIDGSDADAPVEYFNLQGYRITNPAPGEILIKRQGGRVSKQLMK